MGHFQDESQKGYTANGALTDGTIVKLASGKIVAATAGTDLSIGAVIGAVRDGETASVRLRSASGTTSVQCGGTIAVGDAVTATTGGKALTTTTAGNQIFGYALEAGVLNDYIEVMPSVAKY